MISFRKRKEETDLKKTLTILDAKTNEVKEIIDIVDEIKEISLTDEKPGSKYSDSQVKDMSFMKSLRDMYPKMKDMETFLMDACKDRKPVKDDIILSDEDKVIEKEKLDKLAEAEGKAAKLLQDAEAEKEKVQKARQLEIEEAEVARHAAAQIN